MSRADVKDYTEFSLPFSVVSKGDISRLVHEFDALDTLLTAATVRNKTGSSDGGAPVLSLQLQAFLDENPVDLDDIGARTTYIKQLQLLKKNIRVMNMTFAVTADPESLQQLSAWLRASVHPQIVIDVHLQPALVAGVYMRSQNRVFDFSVRNALVSKRSELKKELEALRG